MARETRGRLSSLDLAPDEAQEDIRWALAELNARKRTQMDILDELNGRLADKGLDLISKSAFNRKAVRTSAAAAKIHEARAVFTGIAPAFTPETMDETNIVVGELIKILIMELLEKDNHTPKGAMELTSAYVGSIRGQAISAKYRETTERAFAKKASEAIEKVGKVKGLTKDMRDRLRAELLGVKMPVSDASSSGAQAASPKDGAAHA